MRRYRAAAKALTAVLLLLILLQLAHVAGKLSPSDRAAALPQATLTLSVEQPPTDNTQEPSQEEPSSQEPTEETEPSQETESTQHTEDGTVGSERREETENGGDTPATEPDVLPTEDDTELHIVTDLADCMITFDRLENDTLAFYAYLVNAQPDMYLRVRLRNRQTPANGTLLTASGRNYETTLSRQDVNFITLYVKQGNATVLEQTYAVSYVARKADELHPSVGEHPPTVTTNLDGFTGQLTNRNFTFLVKARSYRGDVLYADHLLVTLDGKTVSAPTGSDVFEYTLYFENPDVGDTEEHTVSVLAWDDEGNSVYRSYRVTYAFVDEGGKVGHARVLLDATVVGLDPETLGGTYVYEIRQDKPAAYAILAMLREFGYEADYARSPDEGFYLRRISRGGMTDYAQIPDALWQKILDDGLSLTGQHSANSLGEFDYTQGAGWMYSINGTLYAGKGLSNYYLSDGDTLYLRFTLAYGKDIGGYNASGGSYGRLPTYCGRWINGTHIDEHAWGDEIVLAEATCTQAGALGHVCGVCGDTRRTAELPALGHDFVETARQEPTETEAGWIDYACARCGETKRDVLPPSEPTTTTPNGRKRNEKALR